MEAPVDLLNFNGSLFDINAGQVWRQHVLVFLIEIAIFVFVVMFIIRGGQSNGHSRSKKSRSILEIVTEHKKSLCFQEQGVQNKEVLEKMGKIQNLRSFILQGIPLVL